MDLWSKGEDDQINESETRNPKTGREKWRRPAAFADADGPPPHPRGQRSPHRYSSVTEPGGLDQRENPSLIWVCLRSMLCEMENRYVAGCDFASALTPWPPVLTPGLFHVGAAAPPPPCTWCA